jgi:hypothetical protein
MPSLIAGLNRFCERAENVGHELRTAASVHFIECFIPGACAPIRPVRGQSIEAVTDGNNPSTQRDLRTFEVAGIKGMPSFPYDPKVLVGISDAKEPEPSLSGNSPMAFDLLAELGVCGGQSVFDAICDAGCHHADHFRRVVHAIDV